MAIHMYRENPNHYEPVWEKALEGRTVSAKPRVIT
jgi:hypothetical protein